MDWEWIAAVSGFALAMAGTPGPNNTMATAFGANYGFRQTLPFMSGVAIGVAVIILVVATVGSPLVADLRIRIVVKWAGLLYLLWLAWQIGSAPPIPPTMKNAEDEKGRSGTPITSMQGALFQLVNPKLWAMVAGAVLTYGSTAGNDNPFAIAVAFAVIFGTATFASTAAWTLIGVGAGHFLRTEWAIRLFNWTMATLLVVSLIPVVVE